MANYEFFRNYEVIRDLHLCQNYEKTAKKEPSYKVAVSTAVGESK